MTKLLLIEDDKALAKMTTQWLSSEKYDVDICHDGQEGLDYLLFNQYDLAILDWDLPSLSGIEIVKAYRGKGGTIPIIFLTGKTSIENKEEGLDTGADDYLTKPFSVKELAARIRAMLRRPQQIAPTLYKNGDIELDPNLHKVQKAGKTVHLTPTDFELLEFLMRHNDQVFSSEALLVRVWPSNSDVTDGALRTTVKRIRSKLDDPDAKDSIIENIPRVGYRIRSDSE